MSSLPLWFTAPFGAEGGALTVVPAQRHLQFALLSRNFSFSLPLPLSTKVNCVLASDRHFSCTGEAGEGAEGAAAASWPPRLFRA